MRLKLLDEAFGYLKRVIVTPAVYPRLVEFLHVNIQSTEQKSHYVDSLLNLSQCFVLIKQSDSPWPYQFIISTYFMTPPHLRANVIMSCTLWANPSPEVTDLFCRLPLPAFLYRLEAFHLRDLMRLWVRPFVNFFSTWVPLIFMDSCIYSRYYQKIIQIIYITWW